MANASPPLVDPRGTVLERREPNVPRLASLEGADIGFIDNKKINVGPYFEELADILKRDWGVRSALLVTKENCSLPASEFTLQRVRVNSHAIITGVGD